MSLGSIIMILTAFKAAEKVESRTAVGSAKTVEVEKPHCTICLIILLFRLSTPEVGWNCQYTVPLKSPFKLRKMSMATQAYHHTHTNGHYCVRLQVNEAIWLTRKSFIKLVYCLCWLLAVATLLFLGQRGRLAWKLQEVVAPQQSTYMLFPSCNVEYHCCPTHSKT